MQFTLKGPFPENTYTLMRKAGYIFQKRENEKMSFIRPLERKGYPRFHLFVKENQKKEEISFTLHFDQKRPSYKGTVAHSGEYEGDLVKKEAERIKQIIQ